MNSSASMAFSEMLFSLSTAEEAQGLFSEAVKQGSPENVQPKLPGGTYRVVDGVLFRLVPGVPPAA